MNNIDPVGSLASHSTLREFARQSSARTQITETAPGLSDRVEISELASFLSRLAELPEDRAKKIVEIRSAIAQNNYVTPDKLDVATERLLEAISVKT